MQTLFFVQIILESLPISSSGHLSLLKLIYPSIDTLSFRATLLAHIPTLIVLTLALGHYCVRWLKFHSFRRIIKDMTVIGIATFITACGVVLSHLIGSLISFRIPLWYGFCITAYFLFHLKPAVLSKGERQFLTFKDGIWLGLAQSFALIPGVSRFATVLNAALFMGFEYRYAFLVCFSLQAVLCGGAGIVLLMDYMHHGHIDFLFTPQDGVLLVLSLLISFMLFFAVIQQYLKNRLWTMGIYMCIPVCLAFFFEHTGVEKFFSYFGIYTL